ncbi:MAG: hypothetical protein KKD29_00935 [Candidatus Omnitrophica bacterium]|nr:hypothetical protein [Candidatus Omnitrophota bacterium]MBU4487516.1 hypothetical protein [Candidatus Omnitrophota bacterium]MCG2704896.1 hypothetical protein [Candidatus Omnitrophota bacterium]
MLAYSKEILEMADTLKRVLDFIEAGFNEHKLSSLSKAIEAEKNINMLQNAIMDKVIIDSKKNGISKSDLATVSEVAETLERIGDECVNLIERIEIKIEENLLFSEKGVQEYIEVFDGAKRSFDMACGVVRNANKAAAETVIANGFHVKELVEKYRKTHNERLVKGICDPRTSNMFFDMLDFAGNIARHSSNVVKALLPC